MHEELDLISVACQNASTAQLDATQRTAKEKSMATAILLSADQGR